MQPAATIISSNFSSLIRDLQQNPSLQEAICFTLICQAGRPPRGWGWLCWEKRDEEGLAPFSSLKSFCQ